MVDTQLIISALEKLAEKLGVTAEHIWQFLIYQQVVEARYALIAFVVFWFLFLIRMRATIKDSNYFENPKCAKDTFKIMFFIIFAIGCLVSTIAFTCTIMQFFNPEYSAFKELLEMVKK